MSSLDRELEGLTKPIPKGVDLGWVDSGKTFTPSDNNNPWDQAPAIMAQWIFNRCSTKTAGNSLLPEERAIGQAVIANINAGNTDSNLESALVSTFGMEVCQRHAGLINTIRLASQGKVPLPEGLDPTVGVNVATHMGDAKSDRDTLRKHAAQLSASALQSYKSEKSTMLDGEVNISASEINISIQSAGPEVKETRLTSGNLDQIKLAAKALLDSSDDIGLGQQQESISASMLSASEAQPLVHKQEIDILDSKNDELDLVFSNRNANLDNFSIDSENAMLGCDDDLQSDIGGTPPQHILQPESELLQQDCGYADENGLEEQELNIELEENKNDELGMDFTDDFEIEI